MVEFGYCMLMKGNCTSVCKASGTLPISVQTVSTQHVSHTTEQLKIIHNSGAPEWSDSDGVLQAHLIQTGNVDFSRSYGCLLY